MADLPRIVLTSGTFDPFHVGHLAYLEAARAFGDQLVVSVSSDEVVRRWKGPKRPFFPLAERVAMLGALKVVDRVVIAMEDDNVGTIRRIKPAAYVKGWDYSHGDPTGRLEEERQAVEALGGEFIIVDPWPRYSSTAIMKALA
jgi:rfaE bifunctional protein nucleotidyltransferase chain/domain